MKLKTNYLTTIYKNVVKGKSYRDIHKELMRDTINSKIVDQNLLRSAITLAKKCVRDAKREENASFIPILIFRNVKNEKIGNQLNGIVYDAGRKVEEDLKNDWILKGMKDAVGHEKIFMLISKHNDSALDHEPYQGRLYVLENWRDIIKDKNLIKKVDNYIKKNNIQTFEWVIGAPVYMMTRPNCRHYFKEISAHEALNNSASALLKKYGMIHEIGPRKYVQTLQTHSREKIAKYRNVETLIRTYEERLDFYRKLNNIKSNEEIKDGIRKTKFLIKKWENYKKEHF